MRRKIVACRACADYVLWVKFDDGVRGSVDLRHLMGLESFRAWRDKRVFETVGPDRQTGSVVWPLGGVRLDADTLYADVASRLASRLNAASRDRAFRRFLRKTLVPVRGLG